MAPLLRKLSIVVIAARPSTLWDENGMPNFSLVYEQSHTLLLIQFKLERSVGCRVNNTGSLCDSDYEPLKLNWPVPGSRLVGTIEKAFAGRAGSDRKQVGEGAGRRIQIRSDEGLTLEASAFESLLRWPIHTINPVDKTKLSCYTSHRRSTTVSPETYRSI